MQAIVARERLIQAEHLDDRARQYLDLKIEGIREAPLSICVCCHGGADDQEALGHHTIRDTDLYSTCLAIENLWLAARAEGVGVGSVFFYRPAHVSSLLQLPAQAVPAAWLRVGYPDERPLRPGLEAAGWARRRPLEEGIYSETWGATPLLPAGDVRRPAATPTSRQPDWLQPLLEAVKPGDAAAPIAVRDRADQLVKPAGSLGLLEVVAERWAAARGSVAEADPRVAVLVLAADHGVSSQSVGSLAGKESSLASCTRSQPRDETFLSTAATSRRYESAKVRTPSASAPRSRCPGRCRSPPATLAAARLRAGHVRARRQAGPHAPAPGSSRAAWCRPWPGPPAPPRTSWAGRRDP